MDARIPGRTTHSPLQLKMSPNADENVLEESVRRYRGSHRHSDPTGCRPDRLTKRGCRRYRLKRSWLGQIAQLVEHRTENPGVAGSIPALPIRLNRLPNQGFRIPVRLGRGGTLTPIIR